MGRNCGDGCRRGDAAAQQRAQAILLGSNTQHKVYAQVARQVDIPILHIGDATGMAIQKDGLKKVGLIGTRFTMEDGFMADWLKEHDGIETLVPVAAPARQELHRIIQKELTWAYSGSRARNTCLIRLKNSGLARVQNTQ